MYIFSTPPRFPSRISGRAQKNRWKISTKSCPGRFSPPFTVHFALHLGKTRSFFVLFLLVDRAPGIPCPPFKILPLHETPVNQNRSAGKKNGDCPRLFANSPRFSLLVSCGAGRFTRRRVPLPARSPAAGSPARRRRPGGRPRRSAPPKTRRGAPRRGGGRRRSGGRRSAPAAA